MSEDRLTTLLEEVAGGTLAPQAALERLRHFPVEQLGYARVDHLRSLLQGYQEVVFCSGKTPEQVVGICEALARASGSFLATRADHDTIAALKRRFSAVRVNEVARTAHLASGESRPDARLGTVVVVSAGTADLPVAEEAADVAAAMGNPVERLYDVGVAGIHRLLQQKKVLDEASVLIVVAGMDGALPSVVGGMVSVPVVAVPTSVGYGASFGGLAALLTMLNSCAAGVLVVNIDNGFGAAAAAARINRLVTRPRAEPRE
ncbi:MAG: nickel pincer cofactor biosynthesis protein LarB [Gemmatimonadetes bacterium]|nr:nickel pincer cofactor biosynthesis protein LarB [Gemmatimonadota bacterium]